MAALFHNNKQPCKMAAANDATVVTCTNNSDYAVICSFFEQFGDKSGLLFPSFHDLQLMLENVEEGKFPISKAFLPGRQSGLFDNSYLL